MKAFKTATGKPLKSALGKPFIQIPPIPDVTSINTYSCASAGVHCFDNLDLDPCGISLTNSGSKLFLSFTNGTLREYDIPTSWEIRTHTLVNTTTISGSTYGLKFGAGGMKLYGANGQNLREYTMTSPYDIMSLSLTNSENAYTLSGFSYPSGTTTLYGMDISPDGTNVICGLYNYYQTQKVLVFSLGTPWDLSTLSYRGYVDVDALAVIPTPRFSADGKAIYVFGVSGNDGNSLHQCNTSIPYDALTMNTVPDATKALCWWNKDMHIDADKVHLASCGEGGQTANRAYTFEFIYP